MQTKKWKSWGEKKESKRKTRKSLSCYHENQTNIQKLRRSHNQVPLKLMMTTRTRYLSELPKGVHNRRQIPHRRNSSNLSLTPTSRQPKQEEKEQVSKWLLGCWKKQKNKKNYPNDFWGVGRRTRTIQMIFGVLEEEEELSTWFVGVLRNEDKEKYTRNLGELEWE